MRQALDRYAAGLSGRTANRFNPHLAEFDGRVQAFRRDEICFGDHALSLFAAQPQLPPTVRDYLEASRLEMSKKFGANVVINPKEEDPVARIMALTGMQGVDVAVEAVGTQATFEAAARSVRRGGTVSSIGVYGLTPMLSMPTIVPSFLHRTIVTTLCPSGRDRMEHLLGLIEHGKVDLTPLFTHRMKLDQTAAAYDLFRSKTEGVLKIAITP